MPATLPPSRISRPLPPPNRASPPTPPLPTAPAPREPDENAAAMWLGVLGSGLVATAALIVGFAGREALGAAGPAGGLFAAAGTTWYLSRRLRTQAPIVANVLVHLARLVAAVAGAAAVAAFAQWPAVTAALGGTTAVACIGWRLGGRWALGALQTFAAGSLLAGIAATTVLPLGPMLAVVAAVLVAVHMRYASTGERDQPSLLLAFAAIAAPLGGTPGSWRVGPGTLERLGLRGEVLAWAAPCAGVLGALALLVWAHRRGAPLVAHAALAGVAANTLLGLGSAHWPRWVPSIWLAVMFVAFQAGSTSLGRDPFWRRVLVPVARTVAVLAAPVVIVWGLAVAVVAHDDGGEPLAAIAPLLFALGFALTPHLDARRRTVPMVSGAMLLLTTFIATSSLTATAAVCVSLLAWMVIARPGSAEAAITAPAAWGITLAAQLTSPSPAPTALAALTLLIVGWAVGRRAHPALGLVIVLGGVTSATAALAEGAGDRSLLAAALVGAGLTAAGLVVTERGDGRTALIIPAALATFAFTDLFDALGNDPASIESASLVGCMAAVAFVAVGAAAWSRGDSWARHLVASSAIWSAATFAVAVGAAVPWVVAVFLLAGVALAGASFARPEYGAGDTAALAALLVPFVFGVQGAHMSLAWTAMTAVGVVITLHGLCRLDSLMAASGAAVALVSGFVLLAVVDADRWVAARSADLGMSPADLAVTGLVALLAATGVLLARISPEASSWETWGPAAGLAAIYLLATIAIGPEPDVRLLVALSGGVAIAAAGAWSRAAAPLVIGTVAIVGSVGLASWTTLRSLPAWAWMAVGGAALLAVATGVERRGRGGDGSHSVRRILTTFR